MKLSSSQVKWLLCGVLWFGTLSFYSWWTYSLVDTNLTLLSKPFFVNWQARRWDELSNPLFLAQQYAGLVLGLWVGFFCLISQLRSQVLKESRQKLFFLLAGSVVILLISHNALSRDIYNYLFNAKMVVQYHANPHVQAALDFKDDPWIRFMHNSHTPAPYGYLWTGWSLLPFVISGAGKIFLLTYLAMRIWMVLGWMALLSVLWRILAKSNLDRVWRWSLFALNPLVLLEVLSNGHNDVWMMLPAVGAWGILTASRKNWHWFAVAGLLGVSIWFKFATIMCLPIFGVLFLSEVAPIFLSTSKREAKKLYDFIFKFGPELLAIVMMIPLLTMRSQQFHPWYAVWFLAWLPLVNKTWLRWALLGLSLTSQLRYMPWLLAGLQYPPGVFENSRLITWSGLIIGLVLWGAWRVTLRRK